MGICISSLKTKLLSIHVCCSSLGDEVTLLYSETLEKVYPWSSMPRPFKILRNTEMFTSH
jgi:hypothetical protein